MLVPGAGIEPARLAAGDFESPTSTNFITRAHVSRELWHKSRTTTKPHDHQLCDQQVSAKTIGRYSL